MVSVLRKSKFTSQPCGARLALVERRLEEIEATRLVRGCCLEIHLVGGDLHHLFFEIDGIAGRAHFIYGAFSFGNGDRLTPTPSRWLLAVRESVNPDTAVGATRGGSSNFSGAKSQPRKCGVSAFATLSARIRWRACGQSCRVRNMDRIGISVMPMTLRRKRPPARYRRARQTLPGVWLIAGKSGRHRPVATEFACPPEWPQTAPTPKLPLYLLILL